MITKYRLEKIDTSKSNTCIIYYYIAECGDNDCNKRSFHLSRYNLFHENRSNNAYRFTQHPSIGERRSSLEPILDNNNNVLSFDEVFFYHMPSSAFTIDERIPNEIREPLIEADHCLKSNFITGASACLRKAIYKLLKVNNVAVKDEQGIFIDHSKRTQQLVDKYPQIDSFLITALNKIHSLTSQEVHENEWENFSSKELHFLLASTLETLNEIYVIPAEKQKRFAQLTNLEQQAKPKAIKKTA